MGNDIIWVNGFSIKGRTLFCLIKLPTMLSMP